MYMCIAVGPLLEGIYNDWLDYQGGHITEVLFGHSKSDLILEVV